MLECFSKSGEDNSSDFVRMPEGQKGKQPKSIAFFPYDRTDRKPVSFSLDQEELRSYVVSGSRNALLTALSNAVPIPPRTGVRRISF